MREGRCMSLIERLKHAHHAVTSYVEIPVLFSLLGDRAVYAVYQGDSKSKL